MHVLVWITARDRVTGAPHSLGFWTGADHQAIDVAGETRTYYGVGALLDVEPVASVSSAQERVWSLAVSPLHAQIAEAVRTYDVRLAPVEVHEWHHDPLTHLPLADPVRVVRGTLMELDLPTPPEGQGHGRHAANRLGRLSPDAGLDHEAQRRSAARTHGRGRSVPPLQQPCRD